VDHPEESIHLRGDPAELGVMRDFVTSWAQRSGLAEAAVFGACLVATEAVTNAMRHACTPDSGECPITVSCRRDREELIVEVTDRGRFRSRPEGGDDSGGRGLFLIRELTRSFELRAGSDGTHLCMRVPAEQELLAASQAA